MRLVIRDRDKNILGSWTAKTKRGFNAQQRKEIAAARAGIFAPQPPAALYYVKAEALGKIWYYTGRSGVLYLSTDKAEAFRGYSQEGAERRAKVLGAMADHLTFSAAND